MYGDVFTVEIWNENWEIYGSISQGTEILFESTFDSKQEAIEEVEVYFEVNFNEGQADLDADNSRDVF